jgi:DNA-binding transcriptional regulator YiaG
VKAAFERGQFLRNLNGLAGIAATVSEAAHKLGLVSGEALREILDTDEEAADIWNQTRLNTIIAAKAALLEAAKMGNQQAIRTVENFLREEKRQGQPSADWHHLSQKELCDLLSKTRPTINEWETKNSMPRNADRTYDLFAVLRWYPQFVKSQQTGQMPAADKLRDLKAAEKELDLAQRRGELLEREAVIEGLVARWQQVVGAFGYKRRELANILHGQTIERMDELLARFFEDIQRQWLNVPEFLRLPKDAEAKFLELLESLKEKE